MASNAAKKLQYDGKPVQVESAIRDGNGAQIDTTYAKKTETGTVDISGGTLKVKTLYAPTSSSSTTLGVGTSSQVLKSNGTTCYWGSDANDTTTIGGGGVYKAKNAYGGYSVLITNRNNELVPTVTGSGYSNATTKTMNTSEAFDPFGIYCYTSSTSNRAVGATCSSSTYIIYSSFDIRYAFNVSSLTTNAPFYIVAQLQSDGMAKLASPYYAQALPSSDDGLIYILLGQAVSTTNISLIPNHPIYYYKNSKIWEYSGDKIPTKVSELTNDSGFTTNTGTITGVSVNGTSVATSGTAALTNIAKTNVANEFTASQTIYSELGVCGTSTNASSFINVWGDGSGDCGVSLGSAMNAATASAYDNYIQIYYDNEVGSQCLTLYPTQLTYSNEGDEYEYYFPNQTGTLLVAPTPASNKDKYLHTNASTGALEWTTVSGGGGGGITEISTQEVRIWGLSDGIYHLTYSGTKKILYYGSSGTNGLTVNDTGKVVLIVTTYSSSYKHWYVFYAGTSTSSFYLSAGYSSSSAGNYNTTTILGKTFYLHTLTISITGQDPDDGKIILTILNTSSTKITTATNALKAIGGYTSYERECSGYMVGQAGNRLPYKVVGQSTGSFTTSPTYMTVYYAMADQMSSNGSIAIYGSSSNSHTYITSVSDNVMTVTMS